MADSFTQSNGKIKIHDFYSLFAQMCRGGLAKKGDALSSIRPLSGRSTAYSPRSNMRDSLRLSKISMTG